LKFALLAVVVVVAIGIIALVVTTIQRNVAETKLAQEHLKSAQAQTKITQRLVAQLSAPDVVVKDMGNMKQIATALEEYSVDNDGHYPTSLIQLTTPYISKVPVDPANQLPYTLNPSPPGGDSYEIDDAGGLNESATMSVPGGPCTSLKYVSGNEKTGGPDSNGQVGIACR
jgi:hypothetical protein